MEGGTKQKRRQDEEKNERGNELLSRQNYCKHVCARKKKKKVCLKHACCQIGQLCKLRMHIRQGLG